MQERDARALPGGAVLGVLWMVQAGLGLVLWQGVPDATFTVAIGVLLAISLFAYRGFVVVDPNEAIVLQLFGTYVGTIKSAGLKWTNPLYSARRVTLRALSQESERLKVNDLEGNPIEIGANVVW